MVLRSPNLSVNPLDKLLANGVRPRGLPEIKPARVGPIGKQPAAGLRIGQMGENVRTEFGEQANQPRGRVSKSFGGSIAERSGQRGARTRGRDGECQQTLPPDRWNREVSLLRFTRRADPDSGAPRIGDHLAINLGCGRCDRQGHSIQVAGMVWLGTKFNPRRGIVVVNPRIDPDHSRPRHEQSRHFSPADRSQPHDQGRPTAQIKLYRISRHGLAWEKGDLRLEI